MTSSKKILDACCGGRMMWFNRGHQEVLFGDKRSETLTMTDRSHGCTDGTRMLHVNPDVVSDFRQLPFADESFYLVAFDPPHLIRAGQRSWMAAKYGKLGFNWKDDLKAGFSECFRVLKINGVLVFKWNETQVKLSEVLKLTPISPLFGNRSGKKAGTHWLVFMKTMNEVSK
ncbi:MAG: SAM-dependent methyltransferase [Victivallales bacterium]|jgi:ubiquinone/menaquinone biosynthesis C-methylase UbiE